LDCDLLLSGPGPVGELGVDSSLELGSYEFWRLRCMNRLCLTLLWTELGDIFLSLATDSLSDSLFEDLCDLKECFLSMPVLSRPEHTESISDSLL